MMTTDCWWLIRLVLLIDLMIFGVCLKLLPWMNVLVITGLYVIISILILLGVRQYLTVDEPLKSGPDPFPQIIEYPIVVCHPDGSTSPDSIPLMPLDKTETV